MSPLPPSSGGSPDEAATSPSTEAVPSPAVSAPPAPDQADLPQAGGAVDPPAGAPPAAPPALAALEPTAPRLVIGIGLGAAAAALGGWILGEYPFTGVMPYLTGVLFALVVAEVMLSITRRRDWFIGGAACLATIGGIGLAVWIQSGEGVAPVPVGGWVAIAIGGAVSLLRGGLRMGPSPT